MSDSKIGITFTGKDALSPVARGVRQTISGFKKDAASGFGIAAGISIFSAATKAFDFAGEALKAFADDQVSVARLTESLKQNAKAWDGNVAAVEAVIRSRMQLGFADDEQRNSLATTVAAIGNLTDALAIQRTAMDLARLKNIDLGQASDVLTKAYNGSSTALRKMGITLEAGTKGMEAINAVQERAAGQAKAYAATTQGAMQVSALAFDEFKESVGGALNDALQPFFKLVVDLTNQTPDLDSGLGRLTQAYRDQVDAMKAANEQAQGQTDIFAQIYGFFAPQDKAIHEFTGTLGNYAQILGVSRKELALFTEAGLTAGKTLPDLRTVLDNLVKTQVAERAKEVGYAWQTGMDAIESSTPPAVEAIRSIPKAATHAVTNMRETIKDGKQQIIEQFRDLAWQSKHPFAQVGYENWLEKRQAAAIEKMKQAVKDGNPAVVEQYRQLVLDIRDELTGLPGYSAGVAEDVMTELGSIGTTVTELMGYGTGGGNTNRPGRKRRRRKGKAQGGPVTAGQTYLVGEQGPELLVMGSTSGRVIPNGSTGNAPIVVNVDGQKLFEIMNRRLGRAVGMGV